MWDLSTENIVQHIVDICNERNIPVSKLESDLGFGNGYLNPKKVSDMKTKRLIEILNYLNISPDEFFDTEARLREIERANNDKEKTATLEGDGNDESYEVKVLNASEKQKTLILRVLQLPDEQQDAFLSLTELPHTDQ